MYLSFNEQIVCASYCIVFLLLFILFLVSMLAL